MNHEKDGNNVLFFDTYALYFVQDNFLMEAEIFFEKFLPDCVEIKPSTIKEAAIFRLQNKKLDLSYIDALGYITAKKHDALFLTGDNAFKKLLNVEFVK